MHGLIIDLRNKLLALFLPRFQFLYNTMEILILITAATFQVKNVEYLYEFFLVSFFCER